LERVGISQNCGAVGSGYLEREVVDGKFV